jgi:hypothetical protein
MKKQVVRPKPIKALPKEVKIKKEVKKVIKKDTGLEEQQLTRLDLRLGKGVGAVRERAKLLERIKNR